MCMVQEALPQFGGHDVIAAAQTGSGKTLSFALPIMQYLLANQLDSEKADSLGKRKQRREGNMEALIVSPTRELAMQIGEHIKAVAKYTSIFVCTIVGGLAEEKQNRLVCTAITDCNISVLPVIIFESLY